jgi:DNA-binding CsgD family transcriptional regulator
MEAVRWGRGSRPQALLRSGGMDGSRQIDGSRHAQRLSLTSLTPRELEVLRRTATGQTNAAVAADLGVTVHAVKFHLASVFRKLNVHNRTQATALYFGFTTDAPMDGPAR